MNGFTCAKLDDRGFTGGFSWLGDNTYSVVKVISWYT